MSQLENNQATKRVFTARSLVLIVLIVGLGAGLAAYAIGNTLATNNGQSNQSNLTGTSTLQWNGYGPRGVEGHGWAATRNGSVTSFRAFSAINNVTVTGFTITSSNHITVNLAWGGSGSAPAITIVSLAPGLSGSNTVAAGWGSSTTVSVSMVGGGSLSSSPCVRVLVVPLTGS
jgi:hypothetical protein